ncbi:MAG: hypothetical protein EOP32_07075 [Rhodococcus sp. (in: high G+C Gram-positive bacteria)]|nr:MAG: hypothetical protein EOP32_07075 [Rhodococcus sp. (in: high G+C Gram-positive bacteria)]
MTFRPDPEMAGWLQPTDYGSTISLRIDLEYLDTNIWSIWLADGRWREVEKLPDCWTITGFSWPSAAKPQLPMKKDALARLGLPGIPCVGYDHDRH